MAFFTHSAGRHLSIDDAKIYFEITGNPTGEPLLLLHGGFGNLTDFNCIINGLSNRFMFIGIDLRGHGMSSLGTSRLTYYQHQADVEAVLSHLGIEACSVLGFSDGGITALRMAADTHSIIKALVVVAGHSQMDPESSGFKIVSKLTPERWAEKFPDSVAYYKTNNPEPDFEALVKAVVSLWTNLASSGYPGASVKQITVPTLLVRGDEDPFFSLKEATDLLEDIDGAGFYNIPYTGHETYEEMPDLFSMAVKEFLMNHSVTAISRNI